MNSSYLGNELEHSCKPSQNGARIACAASSGLVVALALGTMFCCAKPRERRQCDGL